MRSKALEESGRRILKGLLEKLPIKSHKLFNRMYYPGYFEKYQNGDDVDNISAFETVDLMDSDKIDWAIVQCERTVEAQ